MKKYSGASNKEIRGVFSGISYSAVTKAFQWFKKKDLGENKRLINKVKGLEKKLSTFKA